MTTLRLGMGVFLAAVRDHGPYARDHLAGRGYHPAVILAKAHKAANKGYTDYGVAADLPWLTDEGRDFLDAQSGNQEDRT